MTQCVERGLRRAVESAPQVIQDLNLSHPRAWDYDGSKITPATEEGILSYIWRIFLAIITCQVFSEGLPKRISTPKVETRIFTCRCDSYWGTDDLKKIIQHVRSPYSENEGDQRATAAARTRELETYHVGCANFRVQGRTVESSESIRFQLTCSWNTMLKPELDDPIVNEFTEEVRPKSGTTT